VIDPCSIAMRGPIDIWQMGLVDQLDIEGGHVRVVLWLTELDGVESVEGSQTRRALWTPDRMRNA
jgi:metal-sulfur cluster biosynthetic enzyme